MVANADAEYGVVWCWRWRRGDCELDGWDGVFGGGAVLAEMSFYARAEAVLEDLGENVFKVNWDIATAYVNTIHYSHKDD